MLLRLLPALLFVSLCACSKTTPSRAFWQNAEVVGVEEQSLEAVMAASTQFSVPIHEDRLAWGRLVDFTSRYGTGSRLPTAYVGRADREILSEHYRFSVKKEFHGQEFTYRVLCAPLKGEPNAEAETNARNLARYVKDGVLEVSLLKL